MLTKWKPDGDNDQQEDGSSSSGGNGYAELLSSSLKHDGDFDGSAVYSTEAFPTFDSSPHKSLLSDVPIEHRIQSSSFFSVSKKSGIKQLPLLANCVSHDDVEALFIMKLNQCCVLFDFTHPAHDLRGKEIKRALLNELLEFTATCQYNYLTDPVYPEIFDMVSENTFRTFPCDDDLPPEHDEEDAFYEASWPHLSLVYEILKNVLESTHFNPTVACSYINERYLYQLVELFHSRDQRERECLRNVLHRIYSRFFPFRSYLRQVISSVFLRYIYEDENFNGISSLLDIYASIIHGFSLPLKAEHVTFLMKVLLPLHRGYALNLYHEQLQICVLHFLLKDESLSLRVVKYIIKNWPRTHSHHQILVLGELERILSVLRSECLPLCLGLIFNLISKLILNDHFQIAERALLITKNIIFSLNEEEAETVVKVVYPSICYTSKNYWNPQVCFLASGILESIQECSYYQNLSLQSSDSTEG